MSCELVNAICRTFPGAEVSDPWGGGHDAWKVGGKMFACIGAVMPGVSIKTDSIETAQMLIDVGVGVKAPYFHRSWVTLPWGTSEEELRHRLAASYRLRGHASDSPSLFIVSSENIDQFAVITVKTVNFGERLICQVIANSPLRAAVWGERHLQRRQADHSRNARLPLT